MGLIGSAIGAAGSIFGGISASKAMKKIQRNVEAQRQKNQNWYDRRYNEDYTQRADAQRILTQTEESIKNRNKQAAGIQAVMGGTDESLAAAKKRIARLLLMQHHRLQHMRMSAKTTSRPPICRMTMLLLSNLIN